MRVGQQGKESTWVQKTIAHKKNCNTCRVEHSMYKTLVNLLKILLRPLHIKFGSMKQFFKALPKDNERERSVNDTKITDIQSFTNIICWSVLLSPIYYYFFINFIKKYVTYFLQIISLWINFRHIIFQLFRELLGRCKSINDLSKWDKKNLMWLYITIRNNMLIIESTDQKDSGGAEKINHWKLMAISTGITAANNINYYHSMEIGKTLITNIRGTNNQSWSFSRKINVYRLVLCVLQLM